MSNIKISITKGYVIQRFKLLSIPVSRPKLKKKLWGSRRLSLSVFSNRFKNNNNNEIAVMIVISTLKLVEKRLRSRVMGRRILKMKKTTGILI